MTSTPSSAQPVGRERRPASPYMRGTRYWIAINLFIVGTPTALSLTWEAHSHYNQPHSSLQQTRSPTTRNRKQVYIQTSHAYRGTKKNSSLQVTLYSNIILAILIWASEVLWQAPHRWPTFLPFTIISSRSGWHRTTPFWTSILTDDLKHHQFSIVYGECNWKLSLAHTTRALFHSICKSRWNPMLTKILLHWLYKFSHS